MHPLHISSIVVRHPTIVDTQCSHRFIWCSYIIADSCIIIPEKEYSTGADPGFSERGVCTQKCISVAGGLGGTAPPEAIGFFIIITPKSCLL